MLDEALLRLRQAATQALDRVEREHGRVVLVVGVEVRPVMLTARLDEHSDHDAKEARDFRHASTLHRRRLSCRANGVALSRAALAQDTTERGNPAGAHATAGRRLQRLVSPPFADESKTLEPSALP